MKKIFLVTFFLLVSCVSKPYKTITETDKVKTSLENMELKHCLFQNTDLLRYSESVNYSPNMEGLLQDNENLIKNLYRKSVVHTDKVVDVGLQAEVSSPAEKEQKRDIKTSKLLESINYYPNQEIKQQDISVSSDMVISKEINEEKNDIKEFHNQKCIELCGDGFYYDRTGAKRGGEERVCTKYPLKCGYSCTVGWNFRYLINQTNYTCQEARQKVTDK